MRQTRCVRGTWPERILGATGEQPPPPRFFAQVVEVGERSIHSNTVDRRTFFSTVHLHRRRSWVHAFGGARGETLESAIRFAMIEYRHRSTALGMPALLRGEVTYGRERFLICT